MKIGKIEIVLVMIAALVIVAGAKAQSGCIEASQHYEGHPKPNAYVVTVFSSCDERRIVKVQILDAIYGEVVREEEFPLDPRETRAVRIEFTGEKMFSYAVSNHPPE